MDALLSLLKGFSAFGWQNAVMILIGLGLIALAIVKKYEPLLLLPIGVGCILVNLPLSTVLENALGQEQFLRVLYNAGIATELFPLLIFIAVGAMIDFSPLLRQPVMIFFGAAAQFGIFAAMMLAVAAGLFIFTPDDGPIFNCGRVGLRGNHRRGRGPTTIFVGHLFAQKYIGALSVAAYSYMSLVPVIQPPVIRALTTRKERMIRMDFDPDIKVNRTVLILFPIIVTVATGFVAPEGVPLVGALMFGNLIRECGVLERLSKSAQNELASLVTLLLGITIAPRCWPRNSSARTCHPGYRLLAFVFDTAGGVLFAKFVNLFLKKKINPMIGAAGISAFPMSARIVQRMAQKEDPTNFILMPAIGANVSGQIGSIIAGAVIISLLV
jgi:oxaloacetate decarboxylase beta subunit